MATKKKLPWFKCYPSDFLNGVADMSPNQGFVYFVVVMRIYDEGGAIPFDPSRIGRRCNLRKDRCEAALQALIGMGKLVLDGDVLSNPRADKVLELGAHGSQQTAVNAPQKLPVHKLTSVSVGAKKRKQNKRGTPQTAPKKGRTRVRARSQKPEARVVSSATTPKTVPPDKPLPPDPNPGTSMPGDADYDDPFASLEQPMSKAPDYVLLGDWIVDTAGLNETRGLVRRDPVKAWLDDGTTAETIKATITSVVERPGFDGSAISSLHYFAKPIARATGKQGPGRYSAEAGVLHTATWTDLDWQQAVGGFHADGTWSGNWGPPPGQDGCLMPVHLAGGGDAREARG